MSDISASAVQSLRARTGVSIMAVKEALQEAGGDEEKAIEILRKRGLAQAVKKADREQKDGALFIAEAAGKAGIVGLRCETDFVSRGDVFRAIGQEIANALVNEGDVKAKAVADEKLPAAVQQLGENITLAEMMLVDAAVIGTYVHSNAKIGVIVGVSGGTTEQAKDAAMHAAAMNPTFVRPEEVPTELVEKEKEIWREQLKSEGKPEAMFDKIMIGKEKKFREDVSLTTQAFVKDPSKTVGQYLGNDVTAFIRIAI